MFSRPIEIRRIEREKAINIECGCQACQMKMLVGCDVEAPWRNIPGAGVDDDFTDF